MSKRQMLVVLLFTAMSVAAGHAQTNNWVGPYGGEWDNPFNWSLGVPDGTQDVVINSGGQDLVHVDNPSDFAWAISLTLGSNFGFYPSELQISNNNVSLYTQALHINQTGVFRATNVTAYGYPPIWVARDTGNAGQMFLTGTTMQNDGNLNNDNSGTMYLTNSTLNVSSVNVGAFTNRGSLTLDGSTVSTLSGYPFFKNSGAISVVGSGSSQIIGSLVMMPGSSLTVNAPLQVAYVGPFLDIPDSSAYYINADVTEIGTGLNALRNLSIIGNNAIVSLQTPSAISTLGGVYGLYGSELDVTGSQLTLTVNGDIFGVDSVKVSNSTPQTPSTILIASGTMIVGALDVAGGAGVTVGGIGAGSVTVEPNATLTLTNQPGGITGIGYGSHWQIWGSVLAGSNNAFAQLNEIDGDLQLHGQTLTVTPITGGALTVQGVPYNSGQLLLYDQSNLTLIGDLHNNGGNLEAYDNSNLHVVGNLSNNYYGNIALGYSNLQVDGSLTNNGDIVLGASTLQVASLTNNGTIEINGGGILNLTSQPGGITDVVAGSTFDIAGTFTAGANNGFYNLDRVEGTVILENGQLIDIYPTSGTLTVDGGFLEAMSGTTLTIHGHLTTINGGISINDPFPTTINITGMLTNLGGQVNVFGPTAFLNAGGISNGGTLTLPEGSTVNLANGFYQLASGTLGEAIGASGFSIISVNGGLVGLDGTLDVLLDPSYNPAVGSTFKFFLFNPGALSGQFASIQNDIFNNGTEKWVVMYDNADGYVELVAEANNQPTPEPASLLLLGSGLLTMAYAVRRRSQR